MSGSRVVVVDASVLINLIHAEWLSLLRGIGMYQFVVPSEVRNEVRRAPQRQALDAAIQDEAVRLVDTDDPQILTTESELQLCMGPGEAACLALAHHRSWCVATDDRRAIARATKVLSITGRVFTTPALFLQAIRAGTMSITEGDAVLRRLEERRFRTGIRTFRDLV